MALVCQELHCLPRSGGWYQQDWFDALKIMWVLEAQAKLREEQQKKRKK